MQNISDSAVSQCALSSSFNISRIENECIGENSFHAGIYSYSLDASFGAHESRLGKMVQKTNAECCGGFTKQEKPKELKNCKLELSFPLLLTKS